MDYSNAQTLVLQLNHFGFLAPLAAFLLFVVQAIFPVFPYVILTAAGGMLFGFKLGFLLAWLGALTGACLAFCLCRLLGDTRFMRRYYRLMDYDSARLNPSMAFWSIVIGRILPVIPTPLINVTAALGGVSFTTFFFSSALGKIPTAILYTSLGLALVNTRDVKILLFIIAVSMGFILLLHYQSRKWNPKL